MDLEAGYVVARVLACGIWVAAGLYKATHFGHTVEEMTRLGIPFAPLVLPFVLALELVGATMLILNYYVWAVSLAWMVFLIPASYIYHLRFVIRNGTIDFGQFVMFWKNVSIAGGLLALVLLDKSRPASLAAWSLAS